MNNTLNILIGGEAGQGLGQGRRGLFQDLRHPVGLLDRQGVALIAAGARIPQLVEPLQGARSPCGHPLQDPPRQRGKHPEDGQRHEVFEFDKIGQDHGLLTP